MMTTIDVGFVTICRLSGTAIALQIKVNQCH